MAEVCLAPVGAFTRMIEALPESGDIIVAERVGAGIVSLLRADPARVRQALGVALPEAPGVVPGSGIDAIATGPGAWLMLRDAAPAGWAEELDGTLAGMASVVDQSGGYAVLRLSGGPAWRLLAKGAFVDLDPASFAPGSSAVTLIAHMGAILWRRPDRDGFEVAIFRSHAASFWHWLSEAADAEGWQLARRPV